MARPGRGRAAPRRIRAIVARLTEAYGPRPWRRHGNALDGLIRTILSQNTTDVNSRAAFASLKRQFSSWHECLDAPVARIEFAIRRGGLAKQKAGRIKNILGELKRQRGRLSLQFLARLPVEEAMTWLCGLVGVGPKTAACVLMFNFNKPVLPVDTHVHRVSGRLGLIEPKATAEHAHQSLQGVCPPELIYPFHVLMIAHGRRTCQARRPACPRCPLRSLCDWPRARTHRR